jgi:hypothetical protein
VTDAEKAELKLRFAREAAAAGKLSHPNLLQQERNFGVTRISLGILTLRRFCGLTEVMAKYRFSG